MKSMFGIVILSPWWLGALCLVGGLLSIAGGLLNLGWFMEHPKAQVFVDKYGHTGARIFYCMLGLAFAGLGLFLVTTMERPW